MKMRFKSKSGFTLFEVLGAQTFVGAIALGATAGAQVGIFEAVFGAGLGLWVVIVCCTFYGKMCERFGLSVPYQALGLIFVFVGCPFFVSVFMLPIVAAKPLPGAILGALGVLSFWVAFQLLRRLIRPPLKPKS